MSACNCYARMEGECICGAWSDSRKNREDELRSTAYAEGFKAGQEAMQRLAQRANIQAFTDGGSLTEMNMAIRAIPIEEPL